MAVEPFAGKFNIRGCSATGGVEGFTGTIGVVGLVGFEVLVIWVGWFVFVKLPGLEEKAGTEDVMCDDECFVLNGNFMAMICCASIMTIL